MQTVLFIKISYYVMPLGDARSTEERKSFPGSGQAGIKAQPLNKTHYTNTSSCVKSAKLAGRIFSWKKTGRVKKSTAKIRPHIEI